MENNTLTLNEMFKLIQLAGDMSGYVHHSGYPVYDGGHTEPEETCKHADCAVVQKAKRFARDDYD